MLPQEGRIQSSCPKSGRCRARQEGPLTETQIIQVNHRWFSVAPPRGSSWNTTERNNKTESEPRLVCLWSFCDRISSFFWRRKEGNPPEVADAVKNERVPAGIGAVWKRRISISRATTTQLLISSLGLLSGPFSLFTDEPSLGDLQVIPADL